MATVVVQFPLGGGLLPGVNSIATSTEESDAWPSDIIAVAYDDGSVRLWDARGPAKPAAYVTAKRMPGDDALEIANAGSQRASVVLCGSHLAEIDWRNPNGGPSKKWAHPDGEDWSALDREAVRIGARTFAASDDAGRTFTIAADTLAADAAVAPFGAHDSIPCGVASLRGSGVTLSVGMEGSAKVWRERDGALIERSDLCDSCWRQSAPQIANPPIPGCFDLRADACIVGRGDGSFALFRVPPMARLQQCAAASSSDLGMLDEITFAPAHATNGLVSVAWCSATSNDIALTAAVSGEVMLWNVDGVMGPSGGRVQGECDGELHELDADNDGDDDLPEADAEGGEDPHCVFAFDLRADVP
eukprot:CAMPEP_0174844518 /NCGR_PEP_ID=MMETSP1114-20130205/11147_1 /TAXON_ID=312471 /ORGANISM="Neobodo designis, Strain CCAP 1951/1" /LENGTH=359 /DNA_ID=CAMNT_0016078755 /DNA_START=35 /DNA_END=1110 /DNA_ORIENTATION=-